jgi:hypothetical protein
MEKIDEYEKRLGGNPVLKLMHLPEKENIWTSHQIKKQKTSFYLRSIHTMDSQPISVDSDTIRYKSKICPFHGLHRSFLMTKTPYIRVKDDYQQDYKIYFGKNLFINMINEARLEFNSTELQFFNQMVLHKHLKLSSFDQEQLGNTDALTNPSTHLEPCSLSYYLPWTYSQGKSMYFPLQLCGDQDDLTHIIDFNLDLKNLLIMEKNGHIIPVDMDKLEVVGNVEKIQTPQLVGEYTTLTKNECSHNVCIGSGDSPAYYFVKNVYYQEDKEEIGFGGKVNFTFDQKKKDPVSRIDWGVINTTSSKKHKTYIFGSDDSTSPIKKSSLFSSVDSIFVNLDSRITEVILNSQTDELVVTGWNSWRNTILRKEDDRKFSPSIPIDQGELNFSLKEGEGDQKFKGFCILERMTCFHFVSYPKNEQERKKMGARIVKIV